MSDTRLKVMEAIARKRTVSAQYNGQTLKLAPHQLFERHGDLYLSALNMTKNWRSADERRLGHFKLDGLGSAELINETFDPLPDFRPEAPRPEDTLLLAI